MKFRVGVLWHHFFSTSLTLLTALCAHSPILFEIWCQTFKRRPESDHCSPPPLLLSGFSHHDLSPEFLLPTMFPAPAPHPHGLFSEPSCSSQVTASLVTPLLKVLPKRKLLKLNDSYTGTHHIILCIYY